VTRGDGEYINDHRLEEVISDPETWELESTSLGWVVGISGEDLKAARLPAMNVTATREGLSSQTLYVFPDVGEAVATLTLGAIDAWVPKALQVDYLEELLGQVRDRNAR